MWGALYRMHADDLERLDHFEGGYERVEIQVEDASGVMQSAVTYHVLDKQRHAPREEYIASMLHWGERWSLPESYLDELRSVLSS